MDPHSANPCYTPDTDIPNQLPLSGWNVLGIFKCNVLLLECSISSYASLTARPRASVSDNNMR